MCVCNLIGSAPGTHTDLKPVTLESTTPKPNIFEKNFP